MFSLKIVSLSLKSTNHNLLAIVKVKGGIIIINGLSLIISDAVYFLRFGVATYSK
jgi:hypothetical protein